MNLSPLANKRSEMNSKENRINARHYIDVLVESIAVLNGMHEKAVADSDIGLKSRFEDDVIVNIPTAEMFGNKFTITMRFSELDKLPKEVTLRELI